MHQPSAWLSLLQMLLLLPEWLLPVKSNRTQLKCIPPPFKHGAASCGHGDSHDAPTHLCGSAWGPSSPLYQAGFEHEHNMAVCAKGQMDGGSFNEVGSSTHLRKHSLWGVTLA
jgi:hypothetical protein